jgi:hypothetical protein
VFSTIRSLIAKDFEEIARRPTPPPPLSDLVIPENEEGTTTMDDEDESDIEHDHSGGYNPWRAQSDHIVSAEPIAPSTLESTQALWKQQVQQLRWYTQPRDHRLRKLRLRLRRTLRAFGRQ